MAIYQFYIAVIPKKGIIEYFGEIPNKLKIDFQKRAKDFLENENELDYFEFIQHKCWTISNVNPTEIISEIDKHLDRANWGNDEISNNWKTETDNIDNDAWILTTENKTQIKEFTFRADLRQPKLKFLIEMIRIAKLNEFLLVDSKGNLVKPEFKKVFELLKKSNAYKFVINPDKFLTDLGNGNIEIE